MASTTAIKSDNELARDAALGRLAAFKELVERYQKKAYHYAMVMVRNSDDAYDLSQEAFVRAYQHIKKFDPAYPFKVWLFHILANLCKNHLRQRKVRGRVMAGSDDALENAPSDTGTPEMELHEEELQAQVRDAVARLPEKFKEIIVLNHFQELSYDQIARVLDIPRGSVMSRLYYARLKLRELLEEMGVEL